MSQHIAQPIPSGSYQQEYHTIIINTPISRPMLLTAFDGESCPPFIEPSFLQSSSPASAIPTSSPISIPPVVPSPIDSVHQHELIKWLQNLPIRGYPTSTTNSEERLKPVPKIWLAPIEPVRMNELHDMLNDPTWQHIFTDVLDLIGNEQDLLSCWWHFDHCINTAIRLEMEAETQQITARNLFERLKLLKINKKLQPIIVAEHRWVYWEMKECWDPLVWDPSKTSSSILPLEFSYPQQSWSTSPAAPITTFNSEESFETAPSTLECPKNPAPPDITTEPINTINFPPLPVSPPSMLQIPPFDYQHSQPHRHQHHPQLIYVVGNSSEVPDRSPRSSALLLWITNWQWAQQTPYDQEGHTLQEMWVRTPFGGHPSISDLESPN